LDSEFLALSAVFIVIGVTGIILFNGPVLPTGECNCIIPSPEPGAAQSTSSFIMAMGLLFLPIGLMRGGLPSFGKPQPIQPTKPGGSMPLPVFSGGAFGFGILLALIGVDVLLVPSILVFKSPVIGVIGAVVTAGGILLVLIGLRNRSAAK